MIKSGLPPIHPGKFLKEISKTEGSHKLSLPPLSAWHLCASRT